MPAEPYELDPFADGYVAEPPPPLPTSRYAPRTPQPLRAQRWMLNLGHRMAMLAFLSLFAACGLALYRRAEYWPMLLSAFVAADTALLVGLVNSWLNRRRGLRSREPVGLIVFGLLMLLPTIALVSLAKSDRLIGIIDSTWQRTNDLQTHLQQSLQPTHSQPPQSDRADRSG